MKRGKIKYQPKAQLPPQHVRQVIPVGRVRAEADGTYTVVELAAERVEDADGWPLSVGTAIRRPTYEHPKWGWVPTTSGIVTSIYRYSDDPRVIVEYRSVVTGGLHQAHPHMVKRSNAQALNAEAKIAARARAEEDEA